MQNALLHVVWTEMCVGSVCKHPPYNNTNPPSVYFIFLSDKRYPLFQIKPFSDSWLCDVTQTQAPPTIVDWH